MPITAWVGRLKTVGASAHEVSAITASYQAAGTGVQVALDELVAGIDAAGLLAMLNAWRDSGAPFHEGYPGGGLPFGSGVPVLTGDPSDDVLAIAAGTGVPIDWSALAKKILTTLPVTMIAGSPTTQQQRLTMTGAPASGSVPLSYRDDATAGLPFNSSASTVEMALNALASVIADGGVACSGGPWPSSIITVVWGSLIGDDGLALPLITADNSGLPGGAQVTVTAGTHVHPVGTVAVEADDPWGRFMVGPNPEVTRASLPDTRTMFSDFVFDLTSLRLYIRMLMMRERANAPNLMLARTSGVYPYTPGRAYLASPITNASTSLTLDADTRHDVTVASGVSGFLSDLTATVKYAGIEDGHFRGVVSYPPSGISGNTLTGLTWLEESDPGHTYSTSSKVSDLLRNDAGLLEIYGTADVGMGGYRLRAAQIGVRLSDRQKYAFTNTGEGGGGYQGGVLALLSTSVGSKGHPSEQTEWVTLDDRGGLVVVGGGKPGATLMTRRAEIGGPQARLRLSQKVQAPGGLTFDGGGTIASLPVRSTTDWPTSGGVRIEVENVGSFRCTFSGIIGNALQNVAGGPPGQVVPDGSGAAYSWLTLPAALPVIDVQPFDFYPTGTISVNRNSASYAAVDEVNHKLTGLVWRLDQAATASASTDTFACSNHGLIANQAVQLLDLAGGAPLLAATTYYVVNPTTSTFQLASAPSGSPINITVNVTSCLVRSTPTAPSAGNPVDGDYFVFSGTNFTPPVLGVAGPIVANDNNVTTARTRTQIGAGIGPLSEGGVGVGPTPDAGFFRIAQGLSEWIGGLDVPGSLTEAGVAVVLTNDSRLSAAADSKRRVLSLTAQGLKAETFFSNTVTAQAALGAGTVRAVLLETGLVSGDVIAGIVVGLGTLATGTAPTMFKVGLADTSGNLVAVSSDQHALLASPATTGKIQVPFTGPLTVASDGAYYAVMLQVGSWGGTQPQFGARTATIQSIAGGTAPGGVRSTVSQTGQTDLSGSISLATGDGETFWLAAY